MSRHTASFSRLSPLAAHIGRPIVRLGAGVIGGLARLFDRRHLRTTLIGISVVVITAVSLLSYFNFSPTADATAQGDGIVVYGASGNATPQTRSFTGTSNTYSSASGTVAGAVPLVTVTRTSPVRMEAITGYVDSGGTLRVMCYNGTTWTNEWSVSVGGTGTTRRFDIAYETNTGDVMVLYSTNAASTNELAYRTKPGSTACGLGNWSGATNLDPIRSSGTVGWVKLAWDRRASSDLLTAIWADNNADLSGMQWSGSAWGNEHTSALETDLECQGGTQGNACAASTVPSTEVLDVDYESLSGDVVVVWGSRVGTGTVNGAFYRVCTGGTATCSWGAATAITSMADDATNLDISANPSTDEVVFASLGDASGHLQAAYWSGTAWTGTANLDTAARSPLTGNHLVSTGWVKSGSNTRSIIAYPILAFPNNLAYRTGNGSSFSASTNTAMSPNLASSQKWYEIQMDPYNADRIMLNVAEGSNFLLGKRAVLSGTTVTWTNSDGASLGTLAQGTVGDASFAYWRTGARFNQCEYKWYNNADSTAPGTQLAAESTAAAISTKTSNARLRTALCNDGTNLAATTQDFKLQYSTSSGLPGDWCSVSTGATCNSSWAARRKLSFNNSASSSDLTNFPVLVKLDATRINYSQTQGAGQDLRFVDQDGTLLAHEIEKWDEAGTSFVWVKVPQVNQASTTDYMYMYYGNASAADGQSISSVWNDGSNVAVYHLSETSGQHQDATANNLDSTTINVAAQGTAAGKIDGADDFESASVAHRVERTHDAALNLTSAFTVEAWVNPETIAGFNSYNTILDKESTTLHANFSLQTTDTGDVSINFYDSGLGTWQDLTTTSDPLAIGVLSHVVATWDNPTNTFRIYVNGVQHASVAAITGTPETGTGALRIGGNTNNDWFDGIIDEVRISSSVRSADWVRANYLTGNDAFVSFGQAEAAATLSSWSDVASPDAWCANATCTTSWSARRKITINNSASSTTLTNFPLLVELDNTRVDYAKTQAAGQDLRFTNASGTALQYDIEKWDEAGTSLVWVEVDSIASASRTGYIWMYYGNAGAGAGSTPTTAWDNYTSVYHLGNGTTLSAADSKNAFNGTITSATATAGMIDGGAGFNGTSSRIQIGDYGTTGSFTMSWWVNMSAVPGAGVEDGMFITSGDNHGCTVASDSNVWCYSEGTTGSWNWDTNYVLPTSTWVNLQYTYNGSNRFLYANGVQVATIATTGSLVNSAASYYLGWWQLAGGDYLSGSMDEARYSTASATRDAEWIEADYLSQTDAINSFGSEEAQSPVWKYRNNATPAHGASISALLTGATAQSYSETYPTVLNPAALNTGARGEWDFALDAANVQCGRAYYFRMVQADGTVLAQYDVYPQLVVGSPTEDALRHGAWFQSSTKQAFGCDWVM